MRRRYTAPRLGHKVGFKSISTKRNQLSHTVCTYLTLYPRFTSSSVRWSSVCGRKTTVLRRRGSALPSVSAIASISSIRRLYFSSSRGRPVGRTGFPTTGHPCTRKATCPKRTCYNCLFFRFLSSAVGYSFCLLCTRSTQWNEIVHKCRNCQLTQKILQYLLLLPKFCLDFLLSEFEFASPRFGFLLQLRSWSHVAVGVVDVVDVLLDFFQLLL